MFNRHDLRIGRMLQEAEDFSITDEQSNEMAVSMGSNAQAAIRELMGLEKKITKPHQDFVAAIKKARSVYTDRLETIKRIFGNKVAVWAQKIRVEREAAAKKQREQAEKLQAKLEADAKRHGIEPVQIKMPTIPVPESVTTRTERGMSYQKKRWTYDIVDEAKIPRKYLTVDRQKITKDLRAATEGDVCTLSIPGVKIYQVEDTVFKTA